jgi:outer membrane protein assembly factor BamD
MRKQRSPSVMYAAGAILAIALSALAGCGSGSAPPIEAGADADFEKARKAYDQGDHLRAIELLEAFEHANPGSKYFDDAIFLLGKSHQANDEQILARADFERLLQEFPRSPFAEDAHFELANSWFLSMSGPSLDPEPAEEAVSGLRGYLRRYPEGKYRPEAQESIDKALAVLAEKDYLNGRTYLRLGRPAAARRYFEKSLVTWDRAPISGRVLEAIAHTYADEKDSAAERAAYERLIAHLGDEPDRYRDGEQLLAEARARLDVLPENRAGKE